MKKYSVISLFSGCGGMDLGFKGGFTFLGKNYKENGFDIVWANEINEKACETYKHNICDKIVVGDIWNHIDKIPSGADVVIGGFPCQDISINGKRAGVSGERSGLYTAMVEVVKKVKPKVFIAENVKGLLMEYNKDSLKKVIRDFEALGYSVNYALYNSADYGVPQRRERVFIIGTPIGSATYSHPPVASKKERWISAESAIKDLEGLEEGEIPNHIWSKAKKSPEQGSRKLAPNLPATTIRAECHGNIQFHYKLDRRISMREAGRFQSFPDSFIFKAKIREAERQIGNAVPPVLAWHIARSIQSFLNKSNASSSVKEERQEELALS